MMKPIRYPEMTKKISTPTKPPGTHNMPAWYATTAVIATARNPSISGLYVSALGSALASPDLSCNPLCIICSFTLVCQNIVQNLVGTHKFKDTNNVNASQTPTARPCFEDGNL